ncbi:MAG: hypothetical protein JKY55_17245 [Aliivibrio sp.]|uniref:hypothetical protein n=1 Tax=Aliivibrio sp. TaxID=1872443 RepID=UPI001A4526E6|nr:hypothetical protein [Aliivibrio sp.]
MKNAEQRQQLLKTLYHARETNPKRGWVSHRDLTDAVGECEFSLDVLTELTFIKKDGYKYRITGQGVIQCEQTEQT